MLRERDRQHQREGTQVRERGENKGIRPARAVTSGEVGGAPDEHRSRAVDCGRKLSEGEHAGSRVSRTAGFAGFGAVLRLLWWPDFRRNDEASSGSCDSWPCL